jgi:hypothetical protein
VTQIRQRATEPVRRRRQQNIKVSDDCSAVFAALAEVRDFSKAALMVAERMQKVELQGLKVDRG